MLLISSFHGFKASFGLKSQQQQQIHESGLQDCSDEHRGQKCDNLGEIAVHFISLV